MTGRRSARCRVSRQPLTEALIHRVLRATLPRANNYRPANYPELLGDLTHFGIRTGAQFRRLMLRHRRTLLEIDRKPFDATNQRIQREELGVAEYLRLSRRNLFFTWEGLTRLARELEFRDAYEEFAAKRRSGEI